MSDKHYQGTRTASSVAVWRVIKGVAKKLPLRLDLWNHSPDGFQWGYGGSGPAQLALAILADALGNEDLAIELHQTFKWEFVAKWKGDTWTMTSKQVQDWAYEHDQVRLDAEAGVSDEDSGIDLSAPPPERMDAEAFE
jgi:hypothetical protein